MAQPVVPRPDVGKATWRLFAGAGAGLLLVVLIAAMVLRGGGDETGPIASPAPSVDASRLSSALLTSDDVPAGWSPQSHTNPLAILIGGTVGLSNLVGKVSQEATVFTAPARPSVPTARISTVVVLFRSEAVARSAVESHRQAASTTTWEQVLAVGRTAHYQLSALAVDKVGDEVFAVRLHAVVREASGETQTDVDYIVIRRGPVAALLVAQGVDVLGLVAKQDGKLLGLLS